MQYEEEAQGKSGQQSGREMFDKWLAEHGCGR
jgi:hypothetical protein